jgi:hypothetical protein
MIHTCILELLAYHEHIQFYSYILQFYLLLPVFDLHLARAKGD